LLAVQAELAFPPPLPQLGDEDFITNTHQARSISTHKRQNSESVSASLPLRIILRTLHAAIQRLPANRPTRETGKPEDPKPTKQMSPWDGFESASWPPIFLWTREPPLVGLARFHERCLKSDLNGLIQFNEPLTQQSMDSPLDFYPSTNSLGPSVDLWSTHMARWTQGNGCRSLSVLDRNWTIRSKSQVRVLSVCPCHN
jgi:hypothetical protein